ncbi:CHAT domain-containing protein [Micromonospora sp. NPDC049151]|uniref:CHAT domain-containing protein n=1 Tax=Micromonospora sp. NPDC049151 TaxID=3155648 RepID=UPI0033E48D7A
MDGEHLLNVIVGMSIDDLPDAIDHFTESGDRLARAMAYARLHQHDRRPETLARAESDFAAAGGSPADRAQVARVLAAQRAKEAAFGAPGDVGPLQRILDEAEDDPASPGDRAMLGVMTDLAGALRGGPAHDLEGTLARLSSISVPPDSPHAAMLPFMKAALAAQIAAPDDRAAVEDLLDQARSTRRELWKHGQHASTGEFLEASARLIDAAQRQDLRSAEGALRSMREALDRTPADHPGVADLLEHVKQNKAQLDGLLSTIAAGPPPASDDAATPADDVARLIADGCRLVAQAQTGQDLGLLRRGIDDLAGAVRVATEDDPRLPAVRMVLGHALTLAHRVGRDGAALTRAVDQLTAAVREAAQPGHPVFAPAAHALAHAHLEAGSARAACDVGLRGLSGYAYQVLLGSGTEDAVTIARDGATTAAEVARWCLAQNDVQAAGTALDTGRDMLLYAATVAATVPELLTAAGEPDLAAGWTAVDGVLDVAGARRAARAAAALTSSATPAVGRLLGPTSFDEIRAALASLGRDALVHLLPEDGSGGGLAVVVPREEAPFSLELPALTVPPAAGPCSAETGEWAWRAAMGPLLHALGRAPDPGRPARLTLVAPGALAAVPWQAARAPDGRYAVREAALSYIVSARLLCELAWRGPVASGAEVTGDAGLTPHAILTRPVGADVVTLPPRPGGAEVAGADDPAFAAATAYLVGGARTVFAAGWPAPGSSAPLLAFMTSHFRREGLPPADALRRAQLWMLDGGRTAPHSMPDQLRAEAGEAGYAEVAAWAGVSHHGR